jgi:hypothetical protein
MYWSSIRFVPRQSAKSIKSQKISISDRNQFTIYNLIYSYMPLIYDGLSVEVNCYLQFPNCTKSIVIAISQQEIENGTYKQYCYKLAAPFQSFAVELEFYSKYKLNLFSVLLFSLFYYAFHSAFLSFIGMYRNVSIGMTLDKTTGIF